MNGIMFLTINSKISNTFRKRSDSIVVRYVIQELGKKPDYL